MSIVMLYFSTKYEISGKYSIQDINVFTFYRHMYMTMTQSLKLLDTSLNGVLS